MAVKQEFFTYKKRPLVRNQDTIYYGRMTDPYVVMMQIKTKKPQNGMEMADRISLQMISTDLDVPPDKMVLRRSEKQGLSQALEIAAIWLDRMDREQGK